MTTVFAPSPPTLEECGADPRPADTKLARAIISNTGAQLIAHAMTLVAAIGSSALLSRYLGPAGFGQYGVIFSYVALISAIVADWGLGQIATREASQSEAEMEPVLATAAAVQCVAAVLAYAALVAAAAVAIGGVVQAGVAIAGLVLLVLPIDILSLVLIVRLQIARLAWVGTVSAALRLAMIGAAVLAGADLITIVWIATLAVGVRSLVLLAAIRHCLDWGRLRLRPHFLRPLLVETWPVGLALTCLSAMTQLPVVLLDRLSSPAEVGYFSAGVRITVHAGMPALMLATTLYPVFSRLASTDRPALAQLASQVMRYLFLLGLPLAALGLVTGPWLVLLLYGDSFAPAAAPFAVLMGQIAVLYPCTIAADLLIALGRQRANLAALAAGAAVVIAGSLVLDGAFGAVGAACGPLVGYIIVGAWMLAAIRGELGTALRVPGWRLLAAGCVLGGVTLAAATVIPVPFAAALGVAVYVPAVFVFGCLTSEDTRLALRVVRSHGRRG